MTWLVAALLAAPCALPQAAMLPQAQREAACVLMAQPAPTPALDRQALDRIYQREGFETARQRSTGALQAYLARLRAWLESFFESSGAEAYSDVTRFVVLLVAAMAAVLAGLRLLRRRPRRDEIGGDGPGAAAPLVLDSPQAHLVRARGLLAAAPREAIREALLSLLSSLERARLARPDRVKTNRELTAELPRRGARPEVAEAVGAALRWYDRAFYSLDEVPAAEAARFLDDVEALGRRVDAAAALEPSP